MADINKKTANNVAGDFFVDTTCINCDTCRQLAPTVFADGGEYSFVYAQPAGPLEKRDAGRALLACPTGSIGSTGIFNARNAMLDFPLELENGVYYCGFNSPESFGGNSYFVKHPAGNWLIDSPKFITHLVDSFSRLGGIKYIFLTHRDDVAEAHKFAERFNSERIIHKLEIEAQPDAEMVLDSKQPVSLGEDFLIIPTPGHTEGHCVLLYKNLYLFSGDHLAWSRDEKRLTAFRRHCWYSWQVQIESMEKLAGFQFSWVLPGHGQRVQLPPDKVQAQLTKLLEFMIS